MDKYRIILGAEEIIGEECDPAWLAPIFRFIYLLNRSHSGSIGSLEPILWPQLPILGTHAIKYQAPAGKVADK